MPDPAPNTVLTDRDRKILLHGKTDMILPEMVRRQFFPEGSLEAARSAIRRLCGPKSECQYLVPEPLDSRRVYYRLTPLAAKTLGICSKYTWPLKRLGRVRRYALAWFIYADQPGQRMLMNQQQFREQFAPQGQRFPHHPFFLDRTTGQEKLGLILIDHNAHIQQIVHKTLKPLGRFLRHGWFDEYIAAGCFLVAVLTFSSFRQRAIQMQLENAIERHFGHALQAMRTRCADAHIEVVVSAIPGMEAVLAAPSTKEKKP